MKYFRLKYTMFRLFIAAVIVVGTLYLPTVLQGTVGHYQAAFGEPQAFVIQSQNIDPPYTPWITTMLGLQDHPVFIIGGKFILNILHIWILIELAAILDRRWRARWCRKNKGHRSWQKFCSRFE